MKKPFHLAWFLSQGYGPKSWRSAWPGSDLQRWMMPDIFVDLAQGLERGCFDYIIIEDSSNVPYTYKGSHDTYLSRLHPEFRERIDRYLASRDKVPRP